jgi:prepilin-type N-terminal cleavage/methylation domain-containing protein
MQAIVKRPIRANTVVDEAPARYNACRPVGSCAGKEYAVRQIARSTPGFTLTEILMAVGILGVGLTMVASVFPVAVETSRRSNEVTMTALCARSVAASLRARRGGSSGVAYKLRDYFKANGTDTTGKLKDMPVEICDFTEKNVDAPLKGVLPDDVREYNPPSFLYEQNTTGIRTRVYNVPSTPSLISSVIPNPTTVPFVLPLWTQGNYVAVVYATPINNASTITSTNGPWRITIVVYRSAGGFNVTQLTQGYPRDKGWNDDPQKMPYYSRDLKGTLVGNIPNFYLRLKLGPGEYMIDRNICRGEAYMIDSVKSPETTTPTIAPATYKTATNTTVLPYTTATSSWYVLPGAVAVYHTIIGD